MTMVKYAVFEHKADLGLHIYGSSFEELLENAGLALFEQIADLSTVDANDEIVISACGDSGEELFMSWLRELLYAFHGNGYLLNEFQVTELERNSVTGIAKGEKMDARRHSMHGEVKGITYHRLEVKEVEGRWEAKVILDV